MKWIVTLVVLALVSANAFAEDWPAWRGPRLDGSSLEKNLPIKWSVAKDGKTGEIKMDNIAWGTPIPGIGHSSPIIHGDSVFLTTCLLKEQKRVLLCLDRRDGKILWQRDVAESPLEFKNRLNSFASSTPATDGKLVFTSFLRLRKKTDNDAPPSKPREKSPLPKDLIPEIVVSAYDFAGKKVWEKIPGRFYSRHGFCSSPVLHKDLVIFNADQDAEAYVFALDKLTGEEKWRINRPNRFRSYCVPLIVEAGGKTQMVLSGSQTVTSYNPDDGSPIWIIKGPTEQYVASLVYGDGLFFLTTGFPEYHNLTIRPNGTGDITKTHIHWHEKKTIAKKAAYVPCPLFVNGYFYVISDLGWLSCFESKTGKRVFIEQLGRHHSGSPVLADGHIYMTDDDGISYVLKANGAFAVVSRNPLGEPCYSSPAVSHGQLFIRTLNHLYCIGKK
ncbi:MAG: PQQ-binding-like beta-propeller repeat protein [Planctomycetes bacterium]|nr:PQQ-binding-like beta-propeller repeat protein [Planctomycetota bacterium]